eukprot:scaffold7532_cov200-Pinguiococcus_pyrenoidosus.AAC.1
MESADTSAMTSWELPMTTDGYFSGADELLQWAEEIDVLDMTGPEASTASTTNSDASVDYDDV